MQHPSPQLEYDSLRMRLPLWSRTYYLGEPLIPDHEFDKHFQRAVELEKVLGITDGITKRVGYDVEGEKDLFRHNEPMLSLHTEVDYKEAGFQRFNNRVGYETRNHDLDYCVQYKQDGLGLNLQYVDGKLNRILTRGNGERGEDVTRSLVLFQGGVDHFGIKIPLTIPREWGKYVEVRGEGILSKTAFKKINEILEAQGKDPKVNARNAIAGLIRTKVIPQEFYGLADFSPYGLMVDPLMRNGFETEDQLMQALFQAGFSFPVPMHFVRKADVAYELFKSIQDQRASIPYDIDGVVYKVNRLELQEKLGWRSREPRWAIAQKFPASTALSNLQYIDIQVGRTGKITPMARVSPVFVGGTTITNATLHNVFDLRKRGVRAGDRVEVCRAGDTIPEIGYRSKELKRPYYLPNFRMPKFCPICGCGIVRPKGEVNYYCTGKTKCPEQVIFSILHFVSRECMDVKGIGEETVRKLVHHNLVSTGIDIYAVEDYDWIGKGGVNPADLPKIKAELHLSLKQKDWRFIAGLGIKHVGVSTAKAICKAIPYKEFDKTSLEQFLAVPDVGPETAKALFDFFSLKANMVPIRFMDWWHGAEFESTYQGSQVLPLSGKVFAFSGTFKSPTRNELKELVESLGGTVTGSPSKMVTYFVTGEDPTQHKVDKAKALGVSIISVEVFLSLTNKASPNE